MKLATLKNGSRDGQLVVVSRDLAWTLDARSVALTLQDAIEHWSSAEPRLQRLSNQLNAGEVAGAFAFDPAEAEGIQSRPHRRRRTHATDVPGGR
jgi:fumarylacetoacetate (FAA) hydrolase